MATIGLWSLVAGLGAAAFIFTYEIWVWLHTGKWSSLPMSHVFHREGLHYPVISGWAGIQKIVDEAMSLPLAIVFLSGGIIIFLLLIGLANVLEPAAAKSD